jgi:hypothetical protein
MVLFAKLIPEKIEASLFAFLTGLSNLNNLFISNNLGNLINLWVGVNNDTLDKTWELYAIQGALSLVPLAFIWLVPKRTQVTKVQRCLEYIDKYAEKDESAQSDILEDFDVLDPDVAKRLGIKNPKVEELDTKTFETKSFSSSKQ